MIEMSVIFIRVPNNQWEMLSSLCLMQMNIYNQASQLLFYLFIEIMINKEFFNKKSSDLIRKYIKYNKS